MEFSALRKLEKKVEALQIAELECLGFGLVAEAAQPNEPRKSFRVRNMHLKEQQLETNCWTGKKMYGLPRSFFNRIAIVFLLFLLMTGCELRPTISIYSGH